MRYECITEIFNLCAGNQMRDVSVTEVETDDPAEYVAGIYRGKAVQITEETASGGARIFRIADGSVSARCSFTPDD